MGFGEILHCVEVVDPLDAIPGVPLNPEQGCVPYVQYRGRFVGSLTLKKDQRMPPTIYAYDMKVWIVAPRDPAHGNGAVIVNPLHTTAFDKLKVPFPVSTPASPFFNAPRNLPQREQPLALKMLGTKFLFRRGKVADTDRSANYTWVGVRWDSRACGHPARYDGDYENNHSMVAALNVGAFLKPDGTWAEPLLQADIGHAMLADFADCLRRRQLYLEPATPAVPAPPPVEFIAAPPQKMRLIAFGHSQTGQLLAKLLHEMADRGPVFDGWIIGGAHRTYDASRTVTAAGDIRALETKHRSDPSELRNGSGMRNGLVFDIGTEQDIHFREKKTDAGVDRAVATEGNEWLRFEKSPGVEPDGHRSYEIAGAAHLSWGTAVMVGTPYAAIFTYDGDTHENLRELAALSGWKKEEINLIETTSWPVPASAAPDIRFMNAFDCHANPFARFGAPRYQNPLDWNPVVRALVVAMEKWLDGTPPPPSAWLATYTAPLGNPAVVRNSLGNALGGIRLPDVEVGRGRFYAPYLGDDHDDTVDVADKTNRSGAYIDHHNDFIAACSLRWKRPGTGPGQYPRPRPVRDPQYQQDFSAQADKLVTDRFLLPADRDALVLGADNSHIGICPPLGWLDWAIKLIPWWLRVAWP